MGMSRFHVATLLAAALLFTAAPAHADTALDAARVAGAGWIGPAGVLAIGLTGLGAALAQGRAVANAMEGLARNPGAAGSVRGAMILGLAMIESLVVLVTVFLMTKI
jgi:F-type H+-transporting ATPase subunit c